MTIKHASPHPRVMFGVPTGAPLMLRGPVVNFAPDEEDGEVLDEAFIERPEDREETPAFLAEADDDIEQPAEDPEEGAGEGEEAEGDGEGEDDPEGEDEPQARSLEDEDEEGEEAAPRKRDWRDRQLEKRGKQLETLRREAEEAKAEAARLRELFSKPEEERTSGEQEEIRRAIRREVEAEVRGETYVQKLNESADKMFDAGATKFPKTWEKRVEQARELFGEAMAQRPFFLEAVTDLENSADVYWTLAGDPDRMESILDLAPHKMGIALAKLSDEVKAKTAAKPRSISSAPAPIKPLQKPAKVERSIEDLINDPKASMEEIDRMMSEQEEAAAAKRRRR